MILVLIIGWIVWIATVRVRSALFDLIPYKIRFFTGCCIFLFIYGIICLPILLWVNPVFPDGNSVMDNLAGKSFYEIMTDNYIIPMFYIFILTFLVFTVEYLTCYIIAKIAVIFSKISLKRERKGKRGLFNISGESWQVTASEYLDIKKSPFVNSNE